MEDLPGEGPACKARQVGRLQAAQQQQGRLGWCVCSHAQRRRQPLLRTPFKV
jgi:hypothetical protein